MIEGLEFARLCRDCELYDANFQPHDAEVVFAMAAKDRHIGPKEFRKAMKYISQCKGVPAISVRQQVMHQLEPKLYATKAEANRFHDGGTRSEPISSFRKG